MSFKNNITRLLDNRKIPYQVHTYHYSSEVHSATQVAGEIGLPAERVFKTLVVLDDRPTQKPMLVMIPGPATLDLKRLAQTVGTKKVKMAVHAEAETITGLQTGGISSLALLNRGFVVYLSSKAQAYKTIAISAGQRGANIELSVSDLIRVTGAKLLDLE